MKKYIITLFVFVAPLCAMEYPRTSVAESIARFRKRLTTLQTMKKTEYEQLTKALNDLSSTARQNKTKYLKRIDELREHLEEIHQAQNWYQPRAATSFSAAYAASSSNNPRP